MKSNGVVLLENVFGLVITIGMVCLVGLAAVV